MNERIKELAVQAEYYAEYTTPQGLEWLPTFKEKFAELIVRECAEIADKAEPYKASDLIKQHFGVNNENV